MIGYSSLLCEIGNQYRQYTTSYPMRGRAKLHPPSNLIFYGRNSRGVCTANPKAEKGKTELNQTEHVHGKHETEQ